MFEKTAIDLYCSVDINASRNRAASPPYVTNICR